MPNREPNANQPPANPEKRRPFQGWGRAIGRAMAWTADALVRGSRLGFAKARQQQQRALNDLSRRPEHTRWRIYTLASYLGVLLITLGAQLWEPNSLHAKVTIESVALPEATIVFVRNESDTIWRDVKVTINGKYGYERTDLPPSGYISLPVDRFASYDRNGKGTFAPKDLPLREIRIECDRGRFLFEPGRQP